ncbi:hypothetical protein ES702_03133 [subsurface metagenome]
MVLVDDRFDSNALVDILTFRRNSQRCFLGKDISRQSHFRWSVGTNLSGPASCRLHITRFFPNTRLQWRQDRIDNSEMIQGC